MFLDTDTVCVNSLDAALRPLQLGVDALASPVLSKGIGRRRFGETNATEAYWHELLTIASADCERFERVVLSGEEIHAYYNSGVIVAKREAGLYARWRDILATMMERDLRPAVGSYYREQSAFAAATLRKSLNFQTLDYRANYAVQSYSTYIKSGRVGPEGAMMWHHTNRLRPYVVERFARLDAKEIDNESVHAVMVDVIKNYIPAIEMYNQERRREDSFSRRAVRKYRRLFRKVSAMLGRE